MNPSAKYFFTVSQAAKFLGVSANTLRNWEKAGKLIPQRTKGGSRRYTLSQLKNLLAPGASISVPTEESLHLPLPQHLEAPLKLKRIQPQLHPLWESTSSSVIPGKDSIGRSLDLQNDKNNHLLLKKLTILAPLTFTVLFLFISTLVFAGYSYLPSSFPSSFPIPSFLSSVILEGVEQPIGSRFYRGLQPLQNDNNPVILEGGDSRLVSKAFLPINRNVGSTSPSVLAAETVKQILEINADTNIYGLLTSEGLTIDTSDTTSPTLGSGVIPAGNLTTTIKTTSLTSNSKIFLTATSEFIGNLVVIEQNPGLNFKVKVTQPNNTDLKFNWWIVESR